MIYSNELIEWSSECHITYFVVLITNQNHQIALALASLDFYRVVILIQPKSLEINSLYSTAAPIYANHPGPGINSEITMQTWLISNGFFPRNQVNIANLFDSRK